MKYTVTITGVSGPEPMFDAHGAALLFGVTVEQIKAITPGAIPAEWTKNARRRAKEAFAATGGQDLTDIFEYWAAKDHDATLNLVLQP